MIDGFTPRWTLRNRGVYYCNNPYQIRVEAFRSAGGKIDPAYVCVLLEDCSAGQGSPLLLNSVTVMVPQSVAWCRVYVSLAEALKRGDKLLANLNSAGMPG